MSEMHLGPYFTPATKKIINLNINLTIEKEKKDKACCDFRETTITQRGHKAHKP